MAKLESSADLGKISPQWCLIPLLSFSSSSSSHPYSSLISFQDSAILLLCEEDLEKRHQHLLGLCRHLSSLLAESGHVLFLCSSLMLELRWCCRASLCH
ncbi:hypothetical protein PAMP_023109 [Pampus punctatissimus]